MKHVAGLVTASGEPTFVVLSAMSGTTNSLVEISNYLYKKNPDGANEVINCLEKKYMKHVDELYDTDTFKKKTTEFLTGEFNYLRSFTKDLFTSFEEKAVVAQGEVMSTNMVVNYLQEQGVDAVLLNALDFMRTDKNSEPDTPYIKEKLHEVMEKNQGHQIYITQGFVCRNAYGEVDNLQRGGSDYTASLIGSVLPADEIQIWTDIDGMHNNDPRFVDNTRPIRTMSFDEAAELAYFGAKILHPATIQPCKDHGIAVLLKNTMDPEAPGTTISNRDDDTKSFHAVAAKDGITVIRIHSARMLMAYGFLRKVFEIFEQYRTPIDMITTSEVAVSLTVDNDSHIDEIVRDLSALGSIEIERGNSIVCVVGRMEHGDAGLAARVFECVRGVPIKMISYGASHRSLAILIDTEHKKRTLQCLNDGLF